MVSRSAPIYFEEAKLHSCLVDPKTKVVSPTNHDFAPTKLAVKIESAPETDGEFGESGVLANRLNDAPASRGGTPTGHSQTGRPNPRIKSSSAPRGMELEEDLGPARGPRLSHNMSEIDSYF